MAFHVTHRYGAMERNPPESIFPKLLKELTDQPEDTEHGSVSVSHESEWCLSASLGGHVVFEHLEDGGERHMKGVSDAKLIELCSRLAKGDISAIESEPWLSGYK